MAPVLTKSEQVFAIKDKQLRNFDLVAYEHDGKKYVGRVIAVGGQKAVMLDDILYIDNQIIEETYITPTQLAYAKNHSEAYTADFDSGKLKADTYWILNDNRLEKEDSRTFGAIPAKDIIGKLKFRYYPLSKAGFIDSDEAFYNNNMQDK
jgi:signal peptidase I